MLIFSEPSLSSCCEEPRGRAGEERGGTPAAAAISLQPKGAAAAASRLASARPSHRPEQPHLEHSCTAADQPPTLLSPARDPPSSRGGTLPSLDLVSTNPPSILPSPIPVSSHHPSQYPPITHPNVLPSPFPASSHDPSQCPPITYPSACTFTPWPLPARSRSQMLGTGKDAPGPAPTPFPQSRARRAFPEVCWIHSPAHGRGSGSRCSLAPR